MRSLAAIAVVLACSVPFFAGAEEKLGKIDRARVVGTPVLEQAPRGLHVWLEDGWYRIAAVTALPVGGTKKMRRSFSLTVRSTKAITGIDLHSWKKSGGEKAIVLHVVAGPDPEIMKFQTEGDLTISDATAEGGAVDIFVGPTSKPAASTVHIGRY